MTRNDKILIILLCLSAGLLGAIMVENSLPRTQVPVQLLSLSAVESPARTKAIREKFIKLGLPLHDARYWKAAQ